MQIGSRIRELRIKKGLTQEDLASAVNTSKQNIHKYENGIITNIPLDKIEGIAQKLEVSPAYLMGWEDKDGAPMQPSQMIPILHSISANRPLLSQEQIEDYIYTDVKDSGEYFALRVQGDSMDAVSINDGDLLIVRVQQEVKNNDFAVVIVNNNAAVRQYRLEEETVTLLPHSRNPYYQPQTFDINQSRLQIIGKVVKIEKGVKKRPPVLDERIEAMTEGVQEYRDLCEAIAALPAERQKKVIEAALFLVNQEKKNN